MNKLLKVMLVACLSLVMLTGCCNDNPIFAYERVDVQKYAHIVYFRNCSIARAFNSSNILIYNNGRIESSNKAWKISINTMMFNTILGACAKKSIKLTKLANFAFIDCFIEQLFYDVQKKEAVMGFTVNYSGKIKSFHIVQSASGHSVVERSNSVDITEYAATGVKYNAGSKIAEGDLQQLFVLVFQQAGSKIAEFVAKHSSKK